MLNPKPVILLIALLMAPAVGAQGVRLKIATLAPDGTLWMKELKKAAEEVEERTDGRVTFRFYPGGTMGTDSAVLRKIRIGQFGGAAQDPHRTATRWRGSCREPG